MYFYAILQYIERSQTMKIKKLIASLLAAALSLSFPMSAFALGHNAAGNDNSGIITGRGGDCSANISLAVDYS